MSAMSISSAIPISIMQGAYKWLIKEAKEADICSQVAESHYLIFSSSHIHATVSAKHVQVADKFRDLISAWHQERGAMSSITEMSSCPSYQSIIGMGDLATPLLLKQLRSEGDEPDQWFWALRAITQCNPVPEDEQGDYLKMAVRWIEWGKQNGHAN